MAERIAALEAATRDLADRVHLQPESPAAVPPAPPPPPSLDIGFLLHQSRGALLRGMPPGAKRLLSAGCAGTWYFDWIEETYGPVPEHLGIEYYAPKPEGLPENVTWIANTASDMSAVEKESCDLVLSGQNIEHLWPEEVSGFLLEAARVLKPGGHLVVDSPNRLLTAALGWNHMEHTVELSLDEIAELMGLAGFDVTAAYGIWLCRDPRSGALMPFDPAVEVKGWSVTERLLTARDHPADSFIWWVEAVRAGRSPDAGATRSRMAQLFCALWPERIQRLIVPAGRATRDSPEGAWVVCPPGEAGIALGGPCIPLRGGRHRVTWRFRSHGEGARPMAICEVTAGARYELLTSCEVYPGDTHVTLQLDLPEGTTFNVQFPCTSTGEVGLEVLRKIELEENVAEPGR